MFPMPDLGAGIETIISNALQWIDTINQYSFFSVLVAFALALTVLRWVIHTLKNPPNLDI